jgi:hypothetical protein
MPRFLAILLLMTMPSLTFADYHYVSHSGSNEYPYSSWETAADTVQAAVDAAGPGDTVYIASGEYEGLVVMYPADSLIAIIGAGMDSTHLFTQVEHNLIYVSDNTYLKGMRFSTIDPYAAIDDNATGLDFMVEECRFAGAGIITLSSNVIVRNCIFENLRTAAIDDIFGTNQSLEVSNCLFRNSWNEPISIETHRAILHNNVVLNTCAYPAFHLYVAEGGYVSIVNNVMYNICSGAMILFVVDDTLSQLENNTMHNVTYYTYPDPAIDVAPSFNWRTFNNTITKCDDGIFLQSDDTISVYYSNFWDNRILDFWVGQQYHGSFDTTYGLIHVDPMFVNPDSWDFHLQAYSPLIDAGDPAVLDIDGTRSDIGAYGGPGGSSYEYQDLPPSVPDSISYRVWNDTIYLDWRDNYEADFFGYMLNRDTISGFVPSQYNLIAEPESSLYADADVIIGETYYYRIAAIDSQGNRSDYCPELAVSVTGVWQGDGAELPRMTVIESNYPNPFNSNTTIVYTVANLGPMPAEIKIDIYDIGGRKVRSLVNERKGVGIYKDVWNGKDDFGNALPSGVYFARISQWGVLLSSSSKKILLVK